MTPKQPHFYVYFLVDPRDGLPFYVGKGSGRRIRSHVAAVRLGRVDNPAKCARIREIMAEGLEVEERIYARFECEQEAYAAERDLISKLPRLTNITSGFTTERERATETARNMLGRLVPFDAWDAHMSDKTRSQIRRLFGPEREFYDHMKSTVEELAHG